MTASNKNYFNGSLVESGVWASKNRSNVQSRWGSCVGESISKMLCVDNEADKKIPAFYFALHSSIKKFQETFPLALIPSLSTSRTANVFDSIIFQLIMQYLSETTERSACEASVRFVDFWSSNWNLYSLFPSLPKTFVQPNPSTAGVLLLLLGKFNLDSRLYCLSRQSEFFQSFPANGIPGLFIQQVALKQWRVSQPQPRLRT